MRILHASVNINGAAWEISQIERNMGHFSRVLVFDEYFGYPYDYNLNFFKNSKIINFINALSFFIKALKEYEVFHFYYGKTLIPFPWYPGKGVIPFLLDLIILKIMRKKIFFTFHGSDVRRKRIFFEKNESNIYRSLKIFDYLEDLFKLVRLKFISIFANKIFVTTPDLKKFIPSAEVTPQRINLENWNIIHTDKKKLRSEIVIFHAPTNRQLKGTEYIIKTIERIKKEGIPIRFLLVKNVMI